MRIRTIFAATTGLAALAACTMPSVEAATTSDVIAFTSNRDGSAQIYTMSADGSSQTRVTSSVPYDDIQPTWSPDGTKLAFSRGVGYQSGNLVQSSIVVRDLTTGTDRVLVNDDGVNFRPAWSPDGTRIAYTHAGPTQTPMDVWIVRADGSGKSALTTTGDATQPTWSPDSTRVVFNRNTEGTAEIWVADVATHATRLLSKPLAGGDYTPSWAPGSRILFTSTRDGGGKQVYVMDADGTHQQRLSTDAGEDKYPSWSPDATRIAYGRSTVPCVPAQNECGTTQLSGFEIFVMNADGSGATRVTARPLPEPQFGESFPTWKPRPVVVVKPYAGTSGSPTAPVVAAAGFNRLPETGANQHLLVVALALLAVGGLCVTACRQRLDTAADNSRQ